MRGRDRSVRRGHLSGARIWPAPVRALSAETGNHKIPWNRVFSPLGTHLDVSTLTTGSPCSTDTEEDTHPSEEVFHGYEYPPEGHMEDVERCDRGGSPCMHGPAAQGSMASDSPTVCSADLGKHWRSFEPGPPTDADLTIQWGRPLSGTQPSVVGNQAGIQKTSNGAFPRLGQTHHSGRRDPQAQAIDRSLRQGEKRPADGTPGPYLRIVSSVHELSGLNFECREFVVDIPDAVQERLGLPDLPDGQD